MMLLTRRCLALYGAASLILSPPPTIEMAAQSARSSVSQAIQKDPTLAGQLVRLAFHDATTGKPNGSIQYELDDRPENRALSHPLNVVLTIQRPGMLSLADTIALAGSQAVHATGGPLIPIRLGRIDASESDPVVVHQSRRQSSDSNPYSQEALLQHTMPSPGLNSDGLRHYFKRIGLNEAEFVALSGSHGMGRHVSLLNMPKDCLRNLTRTCLEEAPVNLPFVSSSVDRFDNSYFQYLLKWNNREVEMGDVAFIPTDVALVVDAGLRRHVERFAADQDAYFDLFTKAYQTLTEPRLVGERF